MFRQDGEKRKEGRTEITVPCLLTWEGESHNGRTVDLSRGGACIARTTTLPPQGASVRLTLFWNGVQRLSGRVLYCVRDEQGAGVLERFGLAFDKTGSHARFRALFAARA